jgi:uncharacterized protein YkwD
VVCYFSGWSWTVSRRCAALVAGLCGVPVAALGAGGTVDPVLPHYATRVLNAVNDYRVQEGRVLLRPSVALERIAEGHSREMADRRRPTHGGFSVRFRRADSDLCVENIAAGFAVPEQAVEGWRMSPSHDRNLLEARVRWVGIVSIDGYTTLFACESDGAPAAAGGRPAR